jgi:putative glycosyltransferase (TIGR04372 family)
MCADIDTYLSLKEVSYYPRARKLDIFCKPEMGSRYNRALLKKVNKHFIVMPRLVVLPFLILFDLIDKFATHRAYLTPTGHYEGELNHIIHSLPSPIKVNQDEILRFQTLIKNEDLQVDRIAVIALRDPKFSRDMQGNHADSSIHRNFDRFQSELLIKELIKNGYGVVRAGSSAETRDSQFSGKFFDYANSSIRSDINDLTLFSLARFCVGMDTGLHNLALILRKPLYLLSTPAFTNKMSSTLLRLIHYCDFLDSNTGLPLDLAEMSQRGVFSAKGAEDFQNIGIYPAPMSHRDIRDFISEIDLFERGIWRESEESKELKMIFLNYLKPFGFKSDSAFKFPNFWAKKSIWLS